MQLKINKELYDFIVEVFENHNNAEVMSILDYNIESVKQIVFGKRKAVNSNTYKKLTEAMALYKQGQGSR